MIKNYERNVYILTDGYIQDVESIFA